MSSYGDYQELNFTTDSEGNVLYGNSGGTTTPTPTTPTTGGGGSKWWESVIGIVPALTTAIAGIFGQNQQQVTPVYLPANTSNSNNTNMLLIGGVALIAILFFTMQQKRK